MSGSGWDGPSSLHELPPDGYWAHLESRFPDLPVQELKTESDRRVNELGERLFLPPLRERVRRLLEAFAADGWVTAETRVERVEHDEGTEYEDDEGAERTYTVYTRRLATSRDVDWVVAVHGMNTRGAWQEEFSWFLATTYGRSVPVSIYKYGMIVAGVLLFWRRRKLVARLRERLRTLTEQAADKGFVNPPDLVAHSFGTWLIGRILEAEADRDTPELRFGRVVLAGCIIRPDYDWARVKRAGVVGEVLNHYGTKDIVVPLAHLTIPQSGPSGRRGFDGDDVLNVAAEGYGHSGVFQHLRDTYPAVWKPFLTWPAQELSRLPGQAAPSKRWRPLPGPLAATLLPWVLVPAAAGLLLLLLGWVGELAAAARPWAAIAVGGFGAATLALLAVAAVVYRLLNR